MIMAVQFFRSCALPPICLVRISVGAARPEGRAVAVEHQFNSALILCIGQLTNKIALRAVSRHDLLDGLNLCREVVGALHI